MPSTVRKERSRWLRTPFTPVRIVSNQFIGCSREPRIVFRKQPVPDAYDAVGRPCDLDVVGDEQEGAPGIVELAHQAQHVGRRNGVEVAGWLVRQNEVGPR